MDARGMQTPEDASLDYEYLSPIGYSRSSHCGYCGSNGQSYSYYANASSLSAAFYKKLLDRSWRRSGKLLYRPDQRRSCCPHYTIRLDSSRFKPSRDQRQVVNRFNKYVIGDTYTKEAARLYPMTREQARRRNNEFCLAERIHEAQHDHIKTPPEPEHRLEVTLESNAFTEEKFLVYSNYQQRVHHEPLHEITRQAFRRFLCSSPLRRQVVDAPDGRKQRLGSYHQCYRLDGKLVAVGVLDLLPNCVSSVYFLYDEAIHKFSPGKLSAVYEIALAAEEGYGWWYPGFYIHSCPKMRYKLDYSPQEILDPIALRWDPLDSGVLSLLDSKPFVSLAEERDAGASGKDGTPQKQAMASYHEDDAMTDDSDEENGQSIFRMKLPGITPLSEIEVLDLDHIPLMLPGHPLLETCDLVDWDKQSIHSWPGIKPSVAELVAALGSDSATLICLDLRRQSQA